MPLRLFDEISRSIRLAKLEIDLELSHIACYFPLKEFVVNCYDGIHQFDQLVGC